MWDLTIHPPPGPSVLAGIRSLLIDVGSPNLPPLGTSVLAGTPPRVHPPSGFSLLTGVLSDWL